MALPLPLSAVAIAVGASLTIRASTLVIGLPMLLVMARQRVALKHGSITEVVSLSFQ